MKIDSTLIRKDMKQAALFFCAVIILILAIWFLFPLYGQQRDMWVVGALETKVVPFLLQNAIKVFYDESDCKQIRYGTVEAASPKGCAYKENISDPSMKSIPDFSRLLKLVFGGSLRATSIQSAHNRRKNDSLPAIFGFECCSSLFASVGFSATC